MSGIEIKKHSQTKTEANNYNNNNIIYIYRLLRSVGYLVAILAQLPLKKNKASWCFFLRFPMKYFLTLIGKRLYSRVSRACTALNPPKGDQSSGE